MKTEDGEAHSPRMRYPNGAPMEIGELRRALLNACATSRQIREIYRKHRGDPRPKPPIPCPNCGKPTTGYSCAWGYNNHTALKCEHCGFTYME